MKDLAKLRISWVSLVILSFIFWSSRSLLSLPPSNPFEDDADQELDPELKEIIHQVLDDHEEETDEDGNTLKISVLDTTNEKAKRKKWYKKNHKKEKHAHL